MPTDTLESLLAYATIPVYAGGLLVLVYLIARYQLQFSFRQEMKRALKSLAKRKQSNKQPGYSPVVYLSVGLLFLLFTVMAILSRKGKQP